MRPLSDTCPKPLLDVAGTPLIGWHLKKLAAAGIRQVVINHAWLGSLIEDALQGGEDYGLEIVYSAEGVALETAGGIARALPLLGREPFLVINGDIFCDYDFSRLLPLACEMTAMTTRLAHLVLVPNPAHHPEGDFVLAHGLAATNGREKLTFSGIGLYHPDLFLGVSPDQPAKLGPLLRAAMSLGRVSAERFNGVWLDVGTLERLEIARDIASRC